MANPGRRWGWILGIRLRGITTLALATVMALAITATAQAQTFTVLHTFEGGTKGDAANPGYGPLARDSAGNIYGTTEQGGDSWGCGKSGCGTVFELHGTKETILHKLSYPQEPYYGVTLGENGDLYGVATSGGAYGYGAVFQRIAGKWTTLYSFRGAPNICASSGLIRDSAGNLYGTGGCGKSANGDYYGGVYKIDPSGKETVLHHFTGPPNDGAVPFGNLLLDAAGNIYGTTAAGGTSTNCPYNWNIGGCGTIFKIDTTGKETVMYSFMGPPNDGANPFAGLIQDAAGNFYGTTEDGGLRNGNCGGGYCGTVFKLDTTGKETILYNFTFGADGANPQGELTLDAAGNLYGTTVDGGFAACAESGGEGCGTVFKLDSNNNEITLHSFTGGADGSYPRGGVMLDSAGNLYGTALMGGDLTVCKGYLMAGCGVVFKITP